MSWSRWLVRLLVGILLLLQAGPDAVPIQVDLVSSLKESDMFMQPWSPVPEWIGHRLSWYYLNAPEEFGGWNGRSLFSICSQLTHTSMAPFFENDPDLFGEHCVALLHRRFVSVQLLLVYSLFAFAVVMLVLRIVCCCGCGCRR